MVDLNAKITALETLISDLRWENEKLRKAISEIISIADDGKHGDPYTDLDCIIIIGCRATGERCAICDKSINKNDFP